LALGLVVALSAAAGCSKRVSPGGGDQAGIATFALASAPADAVCLQVTVTGSRQVVRSIDLTAGQSTTFTLTGLPLGMVTFAESAFGVACAAVTPDSVPTWISDPVPATLVAGVAAHVTIVLHRNAGQAIVTSDFQDDDGGITVDDGGAPVDSGTSGDAGTGGDAGACVGPNGCYSCEPMTADQLSTSCNGQCFPYDDSTLPLLPGGVLPPLP
jgi:hypothetical protein